MITRALAANGAHRVYIIGRRLSVLEQTATEFPDIVKAVECDVTSKESLKAAADLIQKEVGYVNLLWCNSGTSGPESKTLNNNSSLDEFIEENWKHSVDEYADTFKINTAGFWYSSLAFLKLLDAGNRQKNVNFSSQIVGTCSTLGFGRFAPTGRFAYGQSKASQQHMMKQLSTHMVPYGIRVNSIAPGRECSALNSNASNGYTDIKIVFPTDMTSTMTGSGYDPAKLIPEKRAGEETDIAGVALFLASKAGSYLNGNVLLCDGGRTSIVPSTY
jgi:NAD(P)-dependent dehydrogenase (short-subunit alcohol dehydrogenase family)